MPSLKKTFSTAVAALALAIGIPAAAWACTTCTTVTSCDTASNSCTTKISCHTLVGVECPAAAAS